MHMHMHMHMHTHMHTHMHMHMHMLWSCRRARAMPVRCLLYVTYSM